MQGPVETAVRACVAPDTELPTPTGESTFRVADIDRTGIVLLFGPKKTPTSFSWAVLEGVPAFLQDREWVRIGANRDVLGNQGTLDGYLKAHIRRQTANYLAVVLEEAGLVELDRERPAKVRLRQR
jgi:hypothetical protein